MSQTIKDGLPKLIGVIHLPALASAPKTLGMHPAEALQRAGTLALKEAKIFEDSGFDGIILENFGDAPFFKNKVPPETVASLAAITVAVREAVSVPIGLNVLRNDADAALSIAAVTGCDFIRVNVLSGVAATDQGIIEGDSASLLRKRNLLGADIKILADVHVKHAVTLSQCSLPQAMIECKFRALADGVILTGSQTGEFIDGETLKLATAVTKQHKLQYWIGSGVNVKNLKDLKHHTQRIIISSGLRKNNQAGAPIDEKKVIEFYKCYRKNLK